MTPAEFAAFATLEPLAASGTVGVDHLVDKTARTLLFGYTCERHTWHVYLDAQGTLHKVVYCDSYGVPLLLHSSAGETAGCTHERDYVPDKRLYMESCDREFCALLHQAGVTLPFTTYDAQNHGRREARHGGFTGRIREEFDDLDAEFIAQDSVHPEIDAPELGRRCLQHAVLELRLPHAENSTGFYLQAHLVPELVAKVDGYVTELKAPSGTVSSGTREDAMAELRWLAGTLGAYHGDAVVEHETYLRTGVLNSRLAMLGVLTADSFNRHTGDEQGTVEDLGAGAFRVRRPKDNLDFVLMPHHSVPHGCTPHSYALYLRHFGSQAFFEAQFTPALQYQLSLAKKSESLEPA